MASEFNRRKFAVALVVLGAFTPVMAPLIAQPVAETVFDAPVGFWLTSSDRSGRVYGASSPSANWAISQWNIPSDLPPFRDNVTENEFARVMVARDGSYTFDQQGTGFPCTKMYPSGRTLVDEFDLLAHPKDSIARGSPSLASLTHIFHSLAVEPLEIRVIDGGCPVTQAGFLTAIVLANSSAQQTLFYQLRFGVVHNAGQRSWALAQPNWFSRGRSAQTGSGGVFGFDDDVRSYGTAPLDEERAVAFSSDLMPRLLTILANGAEYGLDQDRSHWTLKSTYHGQNAWGHLDVRSRWHGFMLKVE